MRRIDNASGALLQRTLRLRVAAGPDHGKEHMLDEARRWSARTPTTTSRPPTRPCRATTSRSASAATGSRSAISTPRTARRAARLERWKKRPYAILALASTVGIPPLLIVSALAGALRISFRAYCVIGLAGRTLRFAVIVAIPWLLA